MFLNAADLWQRETDLPTIPTFSQSLDHVLGNDGVQLGSITEVLGLPGTGKTQLCLQLCASIQIPKSLGGLEAEAIYVDTNTNFTIHRFKDILLASLEKCQTLLKATNPICEDDVLSKLHYVKAIGVEKFCSLMYTLPHLIEERPKVRLIAIDSITDPFKEGVTLNRRTGLLFRLMADLQRIAISRQIAERASRPICNLSPKASLREKFKEINVLTVISQIVLTNQMSTRVGLSTGAIVGALGDAWSHRCNVRLLLSAPHSMNSERLAALIKSNSSSERVGKFKITRGGIRDIE